MMRWLRKPMAVMTAVLAISSTTAIDAQTDTATTSFDVNGLKVILRRNTANDVVAANLYLLGGTQQLTPATQGIESFLLNASELGTKLFPKAMWALLGLHECYTRLGRETEAALIKPALDVALGRADAEVQSSCFCAMPLGEECCE